MKLLLIKLSLIVILKMSYCFNTTQTTPYQIAKLRIYNCQISLIRKNLELPHHQTLHHVVRLRKLYTDFCNRFGFGSHEFLNEYYLEKWETYHFLYARLAILVKDDHKLYHHLEGHMYYPDIDFKLARGYRVYQYQSRIHAIGYNNRHGYYLVNASVYNPYPSFERR